MEAHARTSDQHFHQRKLGAKRRSFMENAVLAKARHELAAMSTINGPPQHANIVLSPNFRNLHKLPSATRTRRVSLVRSKTHNTSAVLGSPVLDVPTQVVARRNTDKGISRKLSMKQKSATSRKSKTHHRKQSLGGAILAAAIGAPVAIGGSVATRGVHRGTNRWQPMHCPGSPSMNAMLVIDSSSKGTTILTTPPHASSGSKVLPRQILRNRESSSSIKGPEQSPKKLTAIAVKAAKKGDLKKIQNIVEAGVSVDSQDRMGSTLLMHATWYGHTDIVKFLCERGCDVNLTNMRKNTALHFAYERGHADIVSILLMHGADKSSQFKNSLGRIPNDMSTGFMDTFAKQLLKEGIKSPPKLTESSSKHSLSSLPSSSSSSLSSTMTDAEDLYSNRATISFEVYSYDDIFKSIDTDADGYVSKSRELPVALHVYDIKVPPGTLGNFAEMLDFTSFCAAINYAKKQNRKKRNSTLDARLDIFLGGACNPTQWRKDVAVPLLTEAGVTFYNPQVEQWHPGLLEPERHAKATCFIVLIVISKFTRGVASLVEAAELIANGRRVVLVIQDVSVDQRIDGQALSVAECKDLNRGRAYLADVAHSYRCRIYSSVETAIHRCIHMVHEERKRNPVMGSPKVKTIFTAKENAAPMVMGLSEADLKAKLRKQFAKADTDKSKLLDPTEFSRVLASSKLNLSREEVDKVLKIVDIDGDGLISYEEFLTVAFRTFQTIKGCKT